MTNMVSNDAVAAAFRTMIVPMKLPPEPDCPDAILEYIVKRVVETNPNHLHWPNNEIRMLVDQFCWLHKSSNFSGANIEKSLTAMAPGGARAFYLAAQNAVLMVHRLPSEPDLVEVYTWAAQLPPDEILKSIDEPLRYRIPESVVKVNFSRLTDTRAFSNLLYDLGVNKQPEALPSTSKAGQNVVEERDSITPMFVTEWLVRALGGDDISGSREQGNALLKKVRDEARYGMGKLLWRRCPIWFALKSAAHFATRLTIGSDDDTDRNAHADLSYKLWVTDVIGTLYTCDSATLSQYYSNLVEKCGSSTMLEGALRLAKRVEKLKQKYSNDSWTCLNGDDVQMRCTLAIEYVVEFLKGLEGGEEPVWARVRLTENDVQDGLVHKLKHSWTTVQRLKDIVENRHEQGSLNIPPPPAMQRLRNLDIFDPLHVESLTRSLANAMSENAPRKIIAALNDVRDNVMQKWKSFTHYDPCEYCDKGSAFSILSESLLQLLRTNLEVSARFGKNDIRIESLHTVLITITIVLLLDRLNCALFPMLSEHKLGLPASSDQFLNALCLAQRTEKEHLIELEEYILSRNRAHGAVFVSYEWSVGSFPTKFAKNCPKMCQVRSEIQAQCRQNEANKLAEYRREKSRYDDLESKVNSSSCKCYYNDYGYKVSSHCKKCSWLSEKNDIHIYYYERLLPPAENEQLAVVYELTEPTPLSCLREAFYLVATKVLDDPCTVSTPSGSNIYHWKDDVVLNRWKGSRQCPLQLSSSAKKWCQSHYTIQHITAHASFVVDCAKNCVQTCITSDSMCRFVNDSDIWSWSVLKRCSVQLEQPRYQALQKYVSGWKHDENQVLCDKSEAHRDRKVASANIPLTEFEAIGKLRAGHSLQIEQFLECMSQRSVSFRERDVATAAMALLWQVAPNSTGAWHRDSWSRIARLASADHLVEDCVRHSQELLNDARENWDGHNVLLVVALFLRAVFEHIVPLDTQHAQIAKEKVAKALRFSRMIAKEWVEKINEATDRCTQEEDTQTLLAKSAAVASTGVLTFLDHDLLMMHDDLADFLHLRAIARDNQSIAALTQHSWQRQHHIHADAAAEAVLQRSHDLIMATPSCLDKFLRLHWGRACSANFTTEWRRYGEGTASDAWYHSEFVDESLYQPCKVEIDVLGGLFLIDGKPCQRLPESIISHPIYIRLFGPSIFSVQPDGCGGFSTKSKVEGATFTFRDGEVPEIEEERDGLCSILVPDASFLSPTQSTNDFPKTFIKNYSHWIACGSSKLFFRPKCYTDDKFKIFSLAQNLGADYVLDLKTRMVEVTKKKGWWCLLDIASHAHQSLFKNIFQRICTQPDLHVFAQCLANYGEKCSSLLAEVRLPRLQNLRFDVLAANTIDAFNPIRATDYQNLLVAENQNSGTLRGLQHGLLLTGTKESNRQYERRVLLMPHGEVRRIAREQTSINVDKLREPAFFKYHLRDEIHDIHPPKPRHATSYLALLHATTSSLFPDPFLGCTGTQKAISLLQSGRCCGNLTTSMEQDANEILEREAITLADIAKLSPARQFYPPHLRVMETVEWPSFLEPLCAHNSFAFLVKQRMEDMSNALKLIDRSLETPDTIKKVIGERTGPLSKRAIVTSSLALYPMDCNLNSAEFSRVFGNEEVLYNWTSGQGRRYIGMKGFNSNACASTLVVGHCGQNCKAGVTDCRIIKGLLQSLSLRNVQGWETCREGFPTGEATCWANVISKPSVEEQRRGQVYKGFHDTWISLYNIARKRSIWGSTEGQAQFHFLASFLAQRYPDDRDCLLQLLLVCRNGATFERIDPPEYSNYENPATDQYVASTIENIVEDALEKFAKSSPCIHAKDYVSLRRQWEQLRNSHNANRQASKNKIISNTRVAWSERRILHNHEVNYEKVLSSSALIEGINTHLTNWKKSEELSQFIDQVSKAMSICQRQASVCPLNNIVSYATARVIDVSGFAVVNVPKQFRLVTMKHHHDHNGNMNQLQNLTNISGPEPLKILTAQDILLRFAGHRLSRLSLTNDGQNSSAPPFPLSLEDVVTNGDEFQEMAEDLLTNMDKSWKLAHSSKVNVSKLLVNGLQLGENRAVLRGLLEEEREFSFQKCEEIIEVIREAEAGPIMLDLTGLWNNVSITAILSKITVETGGDPSTFPIIIQLHFKLGLSIRRAQRATRCLRLLDNGSQVYARLARELENDGSCGWEPSVYPEWLLLELDNDFCIRENQAEVAKVFLSEDMTNQLLQLNMGEGKTDVIVPMIMAHFGAMAKRRALENKSYNMTELCCVTVLNSLYPSNSSTWQWRIGGILGQRIYPMLFRRDLALGTSEASQMLTELEYITENGHVIVTVPEQRLSQENKVVELASPTAIYADIEASEAFLKVLRFLKDRCRHFLDESDMILSPLYQLIYTLGDPVDMDGGVLRWSVVAAALQSVSDMAAELQKRFLSRHLVEVHLQEEPHFSAVRLLDGDGADEVWDFIRKRVLDDVMRTGTATKHLEARPKLLQEEVDRFQSMVLDFNVDTRTIRLCENTTTTCKSLQRRAEILRGLLTHDALRFALGKRWRVDFGSHPSRLNYLMAVPYRYKDVAAERTEFKHPDIMLLHTMQHYYQNGLLPDQLAEVFQKLENMAESQSKALFNKWAAQSGANSNQHNFRPVLDYTSVNCADAAQFEHQLLPQFRYHVEVIDFYLVRTVFPVQAKQFPNEISANSWDLCPVPRVDSRRVDDSRFPTKGFSGTDGSQPVLPATVTQKNLPSGDVTNGLQMISLLAPKNNEVSFLMDDNVAESLVLLLATQKRVNMVLDPGAIILEMGNHQFAVAWLAARPDMEAAVFFNERDKECVITQTCPDEPVERVGSPYADNLSHCLIYLDDVHTRGVDFLLPLDSRAILTLGKGLDKDKLMQAAMRLRQLGPGGQSLHFVASAEVGEALKKCGVQPTSGVNASTNSSKILAWALSNKVKRNCDLIPYYAAQGADHLKRRRAFSELSSTEATKTSTQLHLKALADTMIQSENLSVSNMYGAARAPELLTDVVSNLLRDISNKCSLEEHELVSKMLAHVQSVAPRVQRLQSKFGQEMERELEQELEEEIHVEKPPPAKPRAPSVSKAVTEILMGRVPTSNHEVYPLHLGALTRTALHDMVPGQFETTEVLVTTDFSRTIEASHALQDGYTKTPQWVLATGTGTIVLLSNFEADFVATHHPSVLCSLVYPRMHLFSPIRRLRQPPHVLTRDVSFDAPTALHVYAGSIEPASDSDLFNQMRLYMGLVPMTTNRVGMVHSSCIDRDGFVPPAARKMVLGGEGLDASPFRESPIRMLLKLYNEIYGLGEELPTSSIGKLLGASELGGNEE